MNEADRQKAALALEIMRSAIEKVERLGFVLRHRRFIIRAGEVSAEILNKSPERVAFRRRVKEIEERYGKHETICNGTVLIPINRGSVNGLPGKAPPTAAATFHDEHSCLLDTNDERFGERTRMERSPATVPDKYNHDICHQRRDYPTVNNQQL
jgi:hypothetical protein